VKKEIRREKSVDEMVVKVEKRGEGGEMKGRRGSSSCYTKITGKGGVIKDEEEEGWYETTS
jgi:hypothetical protein